MSVNVENPQRPGAGLLRRRIGGMTLIELMVALAIGAFLMLGAVTVFMQGRQAFRVNEAVARLQENGRFALDAVEPDIRMVHYFGLTTRSGKIENRALQTAAHTLGPEDCGPNWAVDFDNAVEGSDDANGDPFDGAPFDCDADTGWLAGTDTLTIRRVAEDTSAPVANTMYIQSWREQPGRVFIGTMPPSPDPTAAIHRLVVNTYYVDESSSLTTAGNTVPSLRRKTLTGSATITDEEVLPGVEDLQVEFGVDTDLADAAGRGVVDRFVGPDDPIITNGSGSFLGHAVILAVRITIRVRAQNIEVGYEDPDTGDQYRRVTISKTVYLRNARPFNG